MKRMRNVLCMLMVLCTLFSLCVPAMAAEETEGNALLTEGTEVAAGELAKPESDDDGERAEEPDTLDASYPLIYLNTTESNLTIPYGEIGKLCFTIFCEYKNERYNVNIYNSSGSRVGYVSTDIYNTTLFRDVTITVNTNKLNMTPGEYTVEYYMDYYTYFEWHTAPRKYTSKLVVLENKCNGNHNFTMDYVYRDPTCEEEGIGRYKCGRCGHTIYQPLPMGAHDYDDGVVTTEPTADTNGVRTFTCNECGATRTESIPALETAPAKPYKIANVVSGVHVYWDAVEGAQKYGLWRSENGKNGTYKWVGNPTVPHFTDTKVETGKTYHYKVTILNTELNVHTNKSESIGITYVSTPDISARYNKAAGIKLEWKKVPGATGYGIYRKSYSGSDAWVRVATISGNNTFTWTDESVKNENGVAYKYTIRALAGADMKTLSGCRNAGRSMVRLTSRVLNSAVAAGSGSVKCTWTTSSAVTGYEVRFLVGSEVYKTFTVGNYKTGVKTFTGLAAGTYKVQVRSYKKIDGMGFYSAWSAAKNVTLK